MVGFHLFVYKVRENFRLRRPFARGTTPSTPRLREIVVLPAKNGDLQIGASFSLLFFYEKTNRKPIKCAFDFRDQLVGIGNSVQLTQAFAPAVNSMLLMKLTTPTELDISVR